MKNSLLLLFTLFSLIGNSQNFNTNDSIDYFSEGLKAFNNNDLINARDFFIKSYEQVPDKNALYNIGQINILLNDTCEACKYFKVLSTYYNDTVSENKYLEMCIVKIDTSFYDTRFLLLSSSENYKYLEETIKTKCDTIITGIIHKKGHKSTVMIGADFINIQKIDVYASYYKDKTEKVYNYIYGTTFDNDNELICEKFKKNIKTYLNAKYDLDEIPYSDRYLSLKLIIDKNGTIIDGYSQDNPFKDYSIVTDNKIVDEIIFSAKRIKDLKPAMIFKTPVYYKFGLLIGF